MPYLNVDDEMPEHPKIDALSDAAYRLHMAGMHYCAKWQTDGFVPRGKARRLTETANDSVVTELIDSDVWHDAGSGCHSADSIEVRTCHGEGRKGEYVVHDYLQWNHSKDWWDRRRAEETERKAKYRAKKKAETEHGTD